MNLTLILVLALLWGGLIFAFPRQFKNIIIMLFKRKNFVVVYQKKSNTGYIDKYLVVPALDFITKVGKSRHDLHPDNAIAEYKGRKYYFVNEADVMPEKLTDDTLKSIPNDIIVIALKRGIFKFNIRDRDNKDILITSDRVFAAFENEIEDVLYRKKKNIQFLIVVIVACVAIAVIIYNIMTIQKLAPLIEALYQSLPDQFEVVTK